MRLFQNKWFVSRNICICVKMVKMIEQYDVINILLISELNVILRILLNSEIYTHVTNETYTIVDL